MKMPKAPKKPAVINRINKSQSPMSRRDEQAQSEGAKQFDIFSGEARNE